MQKLTSRRYRFEPFEVHFGTGELRRRGLRVKLSGQPLHILEMLLERPGEVVSREELRRHLWEDDTFVDFESGLNAAVNRLREALGDSAAKPRYIETLPRLGYRFIASVSGPGTGEQPPSATIGLTAETNGHLTDPAPAPAIAPSLASSGQTEQPVTPPVTADTSSGTDAEAISDSVAASSAAMPEAGMPGTGIQKLKWLLLAVCLGLAAVLGLWMRHRRLHAEEPIRSLVVLPLKNLSGDAAQDYLADGMTEELIGRLSAIHDLRVISRTSAMQFKDTKFSTPEIAKALHVDALVEGSVMREGGRVRVHAQLIRGATDEHFWSETYDRNFSDVLALQSDVAQSIAEKVEVTVTGKERSRLIAARSVAPEVYEIYLKALDAPDNTKAQVEQKIAQFEEAIHKDPTFAPAYVGLATAYDVLSTILVGGATPGEARPKMISAARKALELDPNLAEAHLLLASTLQKQWHWAEAEAEYRRALELSPNDARAHAAFGSWLMCQGDVENALSWTQRGRELDPFVVDGSDIGWILFMGHRYDEAIRELRSVLAVHPESVNALGTLGFVLIADGRSQEAIPILEKRAFLLDRSPGAVELLATANARAGHRTEALRLVEELKLRRQKGYVPPGAFINPYLALGEYDEAFVWFERAYHEQSNILQFLKVHPFFDPVRNDPRFVDLVNRVGLN